MIILILDKMLPTDREAVKQNYEEGSARSSATFQQKAPDWGRMEQQHLPQQQNGEILFSLERRNKITGI